MGNFSADHLLDNLPTPVFHIDSKGKLLFVNKALLELAGSDFDQLLGKGIYSTIAPKFMDYYLEREKNLLLSGGSEAVEGMAVNGAGRELSVVYNRSCIHDEEGRVSGMVVSILDLTELKTIERALGRSETWKQAILDGFPGTLALFDRSMNVVWANENFNIGCGHIEGGCSYDPKIPLAKECLNCPVLKSLETGQVESEIRKIEEPFGSGNIKYFEMLATPVHGRDGKLSNVVVVVRDVSDRYKLEEQLRHAQKMEAIGTLAGGIAHDFNNILTPVIGYSEILKLQARQQGWEENSEYSSYIDGILRAAKRAQGLVEQILTFSRSKEEGDTPQNLSPIVKEVLRLLESTLPSTIRIKKNINTRCGKVSIDPFLLHQVVISLCTNGADAMAGEVGELGVTLDEVDVEGYRWVCLTITDTGKGIDEKQLGRIFDPYFTTKEKEQGTGMGLAMVHGIISRQNGRIDVSSELGEGTRFEVYLPLAEQEDRPESMVAAQKDLMGSGMLLLVDDEEEVIEVTGQLLTLLGYEVVSISSAPDALELFSNGPEKYDLVITDLTMPYMTGIDLSRRIRELSPEIPIILCTGYLDALDPDTLAGSGISTSLAKPVTIKGLGEAIRGLLQ
ncbi:MAG: ATP-binding protein [Thermodesulfobacteriota bacterium]